MKTADRRVVIVGAGMSGLTAAAYLSREGYDVQLLEKNRRCGGLLNSFEREGFVFDSGARSIINSGIIQPMIRQLGLDLELLPNTVSIGMEDEVLTVTSKDNLDDYKHMLKKFYPESSGDIEKIIAKIKKVLKHTAVLYGIDNPNFKNLKEDKNFLLRELLPWMPKFLYTMMRINRMQEPVEDVLAELSTNQSLIDFISQHFFKKTPYFFALGYFYVYLDYVYPKDGTRSLPEAMKQKIIDWGGRIQCETEITEVVPSEKKVIDARGHAYEYDRLIWCSDLKTLYRRLNTKNLKPEIVRKIEQKKDMYLSKHGEDSIFTLFIGADEPAETFKSICSEHFFYTPSRKGLGNTHRSELKTLLQNFNNLTRKDILQWVEKYCRLNTYEISIPVLRQSSLAPEGKTGLIISLLFEYDLIKKVQEAGWVDTFKTEVENRMLDTLSQSIYPNLKDKVILQFSSTPLTIQNVVGSSEGAIVGWSNETGIPVVHNLLKIASSVKTPIPHVYQAGQWAYSPAGIPTAILTGSFAAMRIIKGKK